MNKAADFKEGQTVILTHIEPKGGDPGSLRSKVGKWGEVKKIHGEVKKIHGEVNPPIEVTFNGFDLYSVFPEELEILSDFDAIMPREKKEDKTL